MKKVLAQAVQHQRVIRVFVSSTFLDMKEEREELVKRVFPKLRKICEKRGVTWGEVDLRWGITDEQTAEGKVLPICLREIHECRPYFICMLGERYGWVPPEIPDDLVELEPWLAGQHKKSITELEILHGALNESEMMGTALFYFRDPHFIYSLAPDRREELLEGPHSEEIEEFGPDGAEDRAEDRRKKLAALKARIKESGLPIRENYESPEQLGELVLEDFTKLIDQLFPEGEELDPLDREAVEHEAFAQSRFRAYIGREEYFDRLDEHVRSDSKPLVVLGESGSGKSALLANWAARYRRDLPEGLLIMHFIGATPYSADWTAMLRRIMGELKRRFDIEEEIPTEPDKLRSAFAAWLHMAAAKDRVVLILDALDQLEDRDAAPDLVWMPPFIPENIRLILSTLPGHSLDDLKNREWPTMEIKPLEDDERKQLIRNYLAQYRKNISESRIEKIASAEQTRNPLYLRALLEELRIFGMHKHLDRAIEHYLSSKSVPALYEKILRRLEQDYEREWPGLVQDAMTFAWASRRGLSEAELLDLLGAGGEPLPGAQWVQFHNAAEDLLINKSGLVGFAHDYVRKAIEDRYLPTDEDQQAVHLRLADYLADQELSPRVIDELPWQLCEANSWHQLYDLLGNLVFFSEAWQEDRFEIKRFWAKVEGASPLRLVDAYGPVLEAPEDVPDVDTLLHVSRLLDYTGHSSEALSLQQFLTEHYRQAGDLRNLASCLNGQASILLWRGELDDAMALLKEQERVCLDLGDLSGLQRSLSSQGLVLWRRGDLDGAMVLQKEVESICRELGDSDALQRSLGSQGLILSNRGDLDGAMALYKEKERICRELGNPSSLQISLGNQASILYGRGDLDGATKLQKEVERTCLELGDKFGLSATLGNQAVILTDRGDLDGAMALLAEQERICRELDNPVGLAGTLNNQAVIFQLRGDLERAMELYKEVERISREHGYPLHLPISLGNQAEILIELGDLDRAMELLKESERLTLEYGHPHTLQSCLGKQAEILMARGGLDEAMDLLNEQERICRELGIPEYLAESLAHQAEVLAKKGYPNEALPLAEEAYRLATEHGFAQVTEEIKPILDDIRSQLK